MVKSKEPLIYVSCLPKNVQEQDLIQLFSSVCKVKKVEIVQTGNSVTPKFNAFVHCFKEEDALRISKIPEIVVSGKRVNVEKLDRKEDVADYIEKMRKTRVYIKKLNAKISDTKLRELFSPFGTIQKAYSIFGSKSKRGLKSGYVVYEDIDSIDKIPKDGIWFDGSKVDWTSYYTKKKAKAALQGQKTPEVQKVPQNERKTNTRDKREHRLQLLKELEKGTRDSNLEDFHAFKPGSRRYHNFRRHFNMRMPNLRLQKAAPGAFFERAERTELILFF